MWSQGSVVSLGGAVVDVSTLDALITLASRAKEENNTLFHPLPRPQVERTDSNVSTSSTVSTASSVSGSGEHKRKRGQSKVAWSRDEDEIISESVERLGQKWARIAALLPVPRTDDSVRNRWHRLQRKALAAKALAASGSGSGESTPVDKGGDMWTEEEDRYIDHAVRVMHLKWRAIAANLSGRTESGCRNRWVRNQRRVPTMSHVILRAAAPEYVVPARCDVVGEGVVAGANVVMRAPTAVQGHVWARVSLALQPHVSALSA
ncbi:hypothetical protein EMIHUDRAFT_457058 [Emiliania huxleyi CCMP1516]|uniref:Uncharacterized protein n=2 Tax=Emiliania huxleyi TaxID=2903 RepID=A0A0D3JX74_EMIH1|nr:hypothetical protein EMIHUDRAFT_457058 [Emiliania huxleyi CCMP1516]EOD28109.1 hypothetical protein EMIHUDRAFT_457058 [Emiliania huxleyi CCMP1516]|eukprot:XP_005780538.1 hypothetical protein EMIHUDRAFT_457058 [Emiliania huxleyi CCMP1516]